MAPHPHRQSLARRLSAAFATRTRTYASRSLVWRLLAPLVFVAAGALFVTSMVTSQGTDLRAGRYDDLDGLANAEAKRPGRPARPDGRADRRRGPAHPGDRPAAATPPPAAKVEALEGPAGLRPVRGPGVTIPLDDAPDGVLSAAGNDVSDLIVHQQDIQAVANALWAGGAEAMTIAGERVVATTGIKCVGNTVVLHGVPYSPPYRHLRDRPGRLDDGLGGRQPLHRPVPGVGRQGPRLVGVHELLARPARLPGVHRPRLRPPRHRWLRCERSEPRDPHSRSPGLDLPAAAGDPASGDRRDGR